MEKKRACECNRCKRHDSNRKWHLKIGDPIKVYSYGQLLKECGIFLKIDHSFLKWLDLKQNLHLTSLQSIQIQKRVH
ncbi:hypothetical protein ACQKMD_20125 [Viridibacillus sp. NPDC096237]|uniref:hypothetical protein n=1 Tax=Viridibacillus sp. NPDC096237 TaxID=3390721 RepID=UPI003D03CCE6